MTLRIRKNHCRNSRRKGIAVTETAILLPIFVVIVFGAIECSNAIFLRQSLTIAAYEAASIVAAPTGTESVANAKCNEILTARNVESFTLTLSSLTNLSSGDVITVEVSAPASAYSIGPSWFFRTRNIAATVYIVRSS